MAMTAAIISTVSTIVSTGIGIYSSIEQSKQQQTQLENQERAAYYQAELDKRNQKLAEEEAAGKRRAGYEEMTAKRQETARMIGKQRAAMGASGAVVDEGSFLDTIADTAERGEIDAVSAYNRGIDAGYRAQLDAWSLNQSAKSNEAAADMFDSAASVAGAASWMGPAQQALGGIASIATTWSNYYSAGGGGGA